MNNELSVQEILATADMFCNAITERAKHQSSLHIWKHVSSKGPVSEKIIKAVEDSLLASHIILPNDCAVTIEPPRLLTPEEHAAYCAVLAKITELLHLPQSVSP